MFAQGSSKWEGEKNAQEWKSQLHTKISPQSFGEEEICGVRDIGRSKCFQNTFVSS